MLPATVAAVAECISAQHMHSRCGSVEACWAGLSFIKEHLLDLPQSEWDHLRNTLTPTLALTPSPSRSPSPVGIPLWRLHSMAVWFL